MNDRTIRAILQHFTDNAIIHDGLTLAQFPGFIFEIQDVLQDLVNQGVLEKTNHPYWSLKISRADLEKLLLLC